MLPGNMTPNFFRPTNLPANFVQQVVATPIERIMHQNPYCGVEPAMGTFNLQHHNASTYNNPISSFNKPLSSFNKPLSTFELLNKPLSTYNSNKRLF